MICKIPLILLASMGSNLSDWKKVNILNNVP